MRPHRTPQSLWVSSVRKVRRHFRSLRSQAAHHALGHPWLIGWRCDVALPLLLFLHRCLDLFRGYGGVYSERNPTLDILVVDDFQHCALLQRLDDRSEGLVLAHPGELTEALECNGLVLLATSLVEKVFVCDKVLVGEVVLNLPTVS